MSSTKATEYIDIEDLAPNPVQGNPVEEVLTISTDDYIIEAVPISYRAPDDNDCDPSRKDQVHDHSVENASLSTEKGCKPEKPNWQKNWTIHPRQRPNGRIDKYYYHNVTNVMCRSLVEVDNYELLGILPRQMKKKKKEEANKNPSPLDSTSEGAGKTSVKRKRISSKNCFNEEKQMVGHSPDSSKAKMKEIVEKFLRESHENQLKQLYATTSSKAPVDYSSFVVEEENAKKHDKIMHGNDGKNIAACDTEMEAVKDDLLMDIPIGFDFDPLS